ncbi:hypothetical protein [Nocardioides albus]|uniref:DUF4064 domain-containing protein n=1 Tax=Nocardioides albus TaxID=1841 RepID=A0A7W5A771_9ACTN|nr:hypothetical protein [Nocardioides albus]MBB3090695.1 hypothetical protein [Nocardioides albus]GGU25827.1 hypothetical protein GCM10007979_25790 [Nocardioides albus]
MSDQYGSFDNPYGGKPPFEGQEPPVQPSSQPSSQPSYQPPPTPYATPQPQGWGQPPPAYGQVPMGQQVPAYLRPQYPQPDPDSRPGTVVAASVMTIVGSVIALLIAVFMVPAGIADYNDPASSDKGITLVMVIWFATCSVLSLAAIPLGIMLLFRSNLARILLTVVGSVAALLSLFVVLYPALIIAAIVMLYTGRAGNWFARRKPGDPWQRPAATPNGAPPTHQQF